MDRSLKEAVESLSDDIALHNVPLSDFSIGIVDSDDPEIIVFLFRKHSYAKAIAGYWKGYPVKVERTGRPRPA